MSIEDIESFKLQDASNSSMQKTEQENKELKKENDILKELVESQKKIINLLEKGKGKKSY